MRGYGLTGGGHDTSCGVGGVFVVVTSCSASRLRVREVQSTVVACRAGPEPLGGGLPALPDKDFCVLGKPRTEPATPRRLFVKRLGLPLITNGKTVANSSPRVANCAKTGSLSWVLGSVMAHRDAASLPLDFGPTTVA